MSGIASAQVRRTLHTALVRLSGLLVVVLPLCAWAIDDDPFLGDEALATAFAGATLIGPNWAEYYAPDGTIVGKVRHLGLLRDFTGKWFVKRDQVCFEYRWSQYNTCSKFRRHGSLMRHFGIDGTPKADGESRRLSGNRLEDFR